MDYFTLTGASARIEQEGAACSLYLDKGYIGMFSAENPLAGKAVLTEAIERLKAAGHRNIVAPIDGNTWFSYRVVSYDSGLPYFPLEPQNPTFYPEVLEALGFTVLSQYASYTYSTEQVMPLAHKSDRVTLRTLDIAQLDKEIETIYRLSVQGFDQNYLYSEISFPQFCALYQKVFATADPNLVRIAMVDDQPAGFLFAFDGGNGRMVLKSMAVLPCYRALGIGTFFINEMSLYAKAQGYRELIAALVREGNLSRNTFEHYHPTLLREYSLYGLEVGL